jgi:hypothetical protein
MTGWLKFVGLFMSRERRREMMRRVAYVLLVPK